MSVRTTEADLNKDIRGIIKYNLAAYGFEGVRPARNMALDLAGMVKSACREFYTKDKSAKEHN